MTVLDFLRQANDFNILPPGVSLQVGYRRSVSFSDCIFVYFCSTSERQRSYSELAFSTSCIRLPRLNSVAWVDAKDASKSLKRSFIVLLIHHVAARMLDSDSSSDSLSNTGAAAASSASLGHGWPSASLRLSLAASLFQFLGLSS